MNIGHFHNKNVKRALNSHPNYNIIHIFNEVRLF